MLRGYATRLQDRIIRTEMRLRLSGLLPPERRAEVDALSLGQLIALRFASNSELPELVARVLKEDLQDRKAIKQLIQDWQGDHLRV